MTRQSSFIECLRSRSCFSTACPNLQDLGKLYIGENLKELLECDLKLEYEAHPLYEQAIACCWSVRDYVTLGLLVEIRQSEEEHIDFLEEQLKLIDGMGLHNYTQSAMGESATAALTEPCTSHAVA